jgi:hypothetical protein
MGTLATNVVVTDPATGQPASFLAGEQPPDWAVEQITNPAAWEADESDEQDGPPARQAKKEVWASYAEANGIDVPGDDPTKDDIIAAVEAAQK